MHLCCYWDHSLHTRRYPIALIVRSYALQVAFVGFAVQAIATRTQPIEGLTKHLADPVGRNITYYLTHLPEVIAGTA